MKKDEILLEIKHIAKENDGKSPSQKVFEKTTGITTYEWQKFWSKWSEALREAGLSPNQFLGAVYSDDDLRNKLIELIRELEGYPTAREMRVKKRNDRTFPDDRVFAKRFGNKEQTILRLLDYCLGKEEFVDIIKMLEPISTTIIVDTIDDTTNDNNSRQGFVYLVEGHRGEYKIGRTKSPGRRVYELGATASVELKPIHVIKTDDPVGIEAYWHKRFQNKRMKREWFKLSAAEVKSFKKWRKIY